MQEKGRHDTTFGLVCLKHRKPQLNQASNTALEFGCPSAGRFVFSQQLVAPLSQTE